MAAGDVFKVTITSTGQGSIYQNTYHVQTLTAAVPTTANFATFVSDAIAIARTYQASSINYTQWEAIQQWGAGMTIVSGECRREGGLAYGGALSGLPGVSISEPLPPQCACVVTWLTGQAGRRRRGRTYYGAQVETTQNDGLWLSTHITDMTTKVTAFLAIYKATGGTSAVFNVGVWSERIATGCVPAPPPAKGHVQVDLPNPDQAYRAIESGVVRPTVFSQRRRTRGVGR